jgi:hypothetical protein
MRRPWPTGGCCAIGEKIKKNVMGGECSTWTDRRFPYTVLGDTPEGKRQLRRHRHRWEDIVKMYLQEVGSVELS